MKISKLFHWLYATLMFLPIIFFVPSCLYYSFNEHATNTETTTINYKYQSNEVNTIDDLVQGNVYFIDEFTGNAYLDEYYYSLNIYSIGSADIEYDTTAGYYITLPFNASDTILWYAEEKQNVDLYYYLNLFNSGDNIVEYEISSITFYNLVFSVDENLQDFKNVLTSSGSILPKYTDYNVIESVSVNTDDTITDKVNRAWSSVWDLPLFAWTHNSFVAAPFSYITGLFGVGSDNTLNYVFAYFVSISICWLVFDLIMYVPNLAHRWLDRSSLE